MQLNLSLEELARVVGGSSTLDPSFLVERIAPLEKAGPNDLAIVIDAGDASVFDGPSAEKIAASKAGIILATKDLGNGRACLVVQDPLQALQKLVNYQNDASGDLVHATAFVSPKALLAADVSVGPLAVIEDGATVGAGSRIGARAVVGKDVRIGANVVLHPSATVLHRCEVGDGSIISSGAVIGSDGFGYQVTQHGMHKIPHIGNVVLGKNVEVGAGCCIDRAMFESTTLGDGVKLDNLVHIAHNVQIGSHTAILAQTGIAGSAQIGAGCQIGGQVAIKDHIKIGNKVKIVSKSGVMKNLNDGEVVAGSPSMPFNQWKRLMVFFLKFEDFVRPLQALKKFYEKNDGKSGMFSRFFGG